MILLSRIVVFFVTFMLAVKGSVLGDYELRMDLVITTLVVISIIALDEYFEKRRLVVLIPLLFLFAAGFWSCTMVFVPLAVFEIIVITKMSQQYEKKINERYIYLALAGGTALALATSVNLGNTENISVVIGMTMLSILLAYYASSNVFLKGELKRNRDLAVETTNELRDKSDYEISLATLKERNRIAREIHDNVGHELTRTILLTGAIKAMNKDEKLTEHLDVLKSSLDNAMNNVRESVHDLHDESVDIEISIKENVRELKERFYVRLNYDMSKDVNKDIKYAIIAIIKECSTNTLKYSNGSNVYISLIEHPAFYKVSFEDDGNAVVKKSDGIGLKNISDRVISLGGNININKDKGFKVYFTIPKNGR